MYVWEPHPHSVFLPLILPASCPSWKKAKDLAQSLRERSQILLNPGTGDERFWGCSVSCYLSQDVLGIWAIRSAFLIYRCLIEALLGA